MIYLHKSESLKNSRGVGIVAVLLIVLLLSLIGGVVITFVAAGAVSKTNDLVREQALGLITAGFEYSLKRMQEGFDPNGDVKTLGNGQFMVDYDGGTGVITITSDVSAMQAHANPQFAIQGPTSSNMADCLKVKVGDRYLSNFNKRLRGITLQNTCNAPVTVTGMTVSWGPIGSEYMSCIRLGGTDVYNDSLGVPSGTTVNITNHIISPCSSHHLDYVNFTLPVPDSNFSLQFHMIDDTTKQAFVQFVANDEAACLNVDMSAAYIGGSGYSRLLGGTLTNSCKPPTTIAVEQTKVSWTPTTPLRNLIGIQFAGKIKKRSDSTPQQIDAGTTLTQDYLQFSSDMRGCNFKITYIMHDGTIKTVPVNLYEEDMAACLKVDTSGTSIREGSRELVGQKWQNTCPLKIMVHKLRTTWSGVPWFRRLVQIRANGSDVWSGWASSHTDVDLNDVEIAGSTTVPVNRYRFNSNMAGGCFTHHMTLFDGNAKDVPKYCP
ncbi:MAG: hypothetical protein ABH871_08740 [Pseudomonadota bacterium]